MGGVVEPTNLVLYVALGLVSEVFPHGQPWSSRGLAGTNKVCVGELSADLLVQKGLAEGCAIQAAALHFGSGGGAHINGCGNFSDQMENLRNTLAADSARF